MATRPAPPAFPTSPPSPAAGVPQAAREIDSDLLRLLRCPLTRSELKLEGDFLVASVGGLRYPVRGGIPVMLVEEAVLPEGVRSLEELKGKLKGG